MAAKRIAFVLGLGAGYVLGAKAGRQRYQQIVGKAQDVWQNPNVQAKADQAQHLAKEKAGQAGSAVAGTVKEKAGTVGSSIADKVTRSSDESSGSSSTSSSTGSSTPVPGSGGADSGAAPASSGSHARSDVPTPEEVSLGGTDGGVDAPSPTPSSTPSPTPGGASGSTEDVDSPSDKLPPHPVAKPGVPGASPE